MDAFDGACAHEWLSGQDRSSGAGRGFESASPGRGQTPHFVEPWGGCCTLADRRRAHRDSHRGLHHSGRRRPRNVRRDRRRKRAQRCLCHGRTSFDRAESGLFSHLLPSDVGSAGDSCRRFLQGDRGRSRSRGRTQRPRRRAEVWARRLWRGPSRRRVARRRCSGWRHPHTDETDRNWNRRDGNQGRFSTTDRKSVV